MSAIFGPAGNAESFPYKSSVDAPAGWRSWDWTAMSTSAARGSMSGRRPPGTSARRRWRRASACPSTPLLHQPGKPRPREPAKDHRLHYRSLSGGGLDGGGPGGHPLRRADEAYAAGGPGHRPALPESGDSRLRRCLLWTHRPVPRDHGQDQPTGDLDEVLELCTLDERLVPCVDFGHLYARSLGELEGTAACASMLDRIREVLGRCGPVSSTATSPRFSLPPTGARRCI
ncbi:endonuclease IV [Flavonifractor plautii]|nr:endonuclease IV [Flavonifractor plautii]